MHYWEHPYYSYRHWNKHPVPFCFSIVDLFSEKEDLVQKSIFPCCSMSWEDQTYEGTFSSLGAFPLCLCSFNAPSQSEAGRNLWRILLFQKKSFGIEIFGLSVPPLWSDLRPHLERLASFPDSDNGFEAKVHKRSRFPRFRFNTALSPLGWKGSSFSPSSDPPKKPSI